MKKHHSYGISALQRKSGRSRGLPELIPVWSGACIRYGTSDTIHAPAQAIRWCECQEGFAALQALKLISGEEEIMFATQGPTQDPSSLVPVALVVITAALVFWRTVIKLLAIGLILMVILGVSELLHSPH